MTATEEPPVEEKVLQFPKQYENMGAQGIPGGQEAFLRKARWCISLDSGSWKGGR